MFSNWERGHSRNVKRGHVPCFGLLRSTLASARPCTQLATGALATLCLVACRPSPANPHARSSVNPRPSARTTAPQWPRAHATAALGDPALAHSSGSNPHDGLCWAHGYSRSRSKLCTFQQISSNSRRGVEWLAPIWLVARRRRSWS